MSAETEEKSQSLSGWYSSLVNLQTLIDDRKWSELHQASKDLVKQLFAKAPTAKMPFEDVVLLSMGVVTHQKAASIQVAYDKTLLAAQKEMQTPDYNRIVEEERIADQLGIINTHISTSWRIVWNYWRGDSASDLVKWKQTKKELEETPLTRYGRLRLMARHHNIGKRITPSFMKMVVQLWPLAVMWVIKKVGPLLISILFKKQLEKRKTKKKMAALSKVSKGLSIGSLKKTTKRRKKRRKRA